MSGETATIWKAPSAEDPILSEIVRRLVSVYRPERVYLFGSTARGEAGPDSDYDLLILVPDNVPVERRDSERGYAAMEGLPRSGDFLIWTVTHFESRIHLRASLPATVLREGKLLYAAIAAIAGLLPPEARSEGALLPF
jgi:predicted nucleotidyltransferase